MGGDLAQSGEHAGGERGPVHRVVADGQGLPRSAEHDLLVGDHAADPQPVDLDPVDHRAAGAVEAGTGRVGHGRQPASRRAAAIELRRTAAVPEGASALSGWCSSTTSTDS